MNRPLRISMLAAALAFVMLLSAAPLRTVRAYNAPCEPYWTVPEGYDENDYNAIVLFLEQEDENGIKNGFKLGSNYDPNDPSTWGPQGEYDKCFLWVEYDGIFHIQGVTNLIDRDLCGTLDLSGCTMLTMVNAAYNRLSQVLFPACIESIQLAQNDITALDLAGCSELFFLDCSYNPISVIDPSDCAPLHYLYCQGCFLSELDISNNQELTDLNCYYNNLTSIDVSNCPNLFTFWCFDNRIEELDLSNNSSLCCLCCDNNELTELDLSGNPMLFQLKCDGNHLTELDLSFCPQLPFDHIVAEGNGTIGYFFDPPAVQPRPQTFLYAEPDEGSSFLGWYSENGDLFSTEPLYDFYDIGETETVVIARFSGGPEPVLPGDIDMSGEVTVSDAIMALRAAMGLIELTPEQLAAADMDGSGEVRIDDAIIILRTAMGLLD